MLVFPVHWHPGKPHSMVFLTILPRTVPPGIQILRNMNILYPQLAGLVQNPDQTKTTTENSGLCTAPLQLGDVCLLGSICDVRYIYIYIYIHIHIHITLRPNRCRTDWHDVCRVGRLRAYPADTILRDDHFRACSASDYVKAVLLATVQSNRTPVAATACLVPFILYPAAAIGRHPAVAHKFAMSGSFCSTLAWCVACGVHPPASVRFHVGKPLPSWLVVLPLVVAPPADRFRIYPGAASCACSCFAHVRSCAQGRCGRCPPGSGTMSDLTYLHLPVNTQMTSILTSEHIASWPARIATVTAPVSLPRPTSHACAYFKLNPCVIQWLRQI